MRGGIVCTVSIVLLFARFAHSDTLQSTFLEVLIQDAAWHGKTDINRNGAIVTTYSHEQNQLDRLFVKMAHSTFDQAQGEKNYGGFHVSNAGTTLLDLNEPSVDFAPLGDSPLTVFSVDSPSRSGGIELGKSNDDGIFAFSYRTHNDTGFNRIRIGTPNGATFELPSNGFSSVDGAVSIDSQGRAYAILEFDNPHTRDMYRFDTESGWVNLTDIYLPSHVHVDDSRQISVSRPVSSNGDVVVQTRRTESDGRLIPEIYLRRANSQTTTFLLDNSSVINDGIGNPEALPTAVYVSDHGDIFVAAAIEFRRRVEAKYRYLTRNGTEIDIESLLPSEYDLVPSFDAHVMNYRGDVLVSARRNDTGLFGYFVISDGRLLPIVTESHDEVASLALTDGGDIYGWRYDNGKYDLVTAHVVLPEPATIGGLLLLSLPFVNRIRRLRRALSNGGATVRFVHGRGLRL